MRVGQGEERLRWAGYILRQINSSLVCARNCSIKENHAWTAWLAPHRQDVELRCGSLYIIDYTNNNSLQTLSEEVLYEDMH